MEKPLLTKRDPKGTRINQFGKSENQSGTTDEKGPEAYFLISSRNGAEKGILTRKNLPLTHLKLGEKDKIRQCPKQEF